jgi:hypothetical protein
VGIRKQGITAIAAKTSVETAFPQRAQHPNYRRKIGQPPEK